MKYQGAGDISVIAEADVVVVGGGPGGLGAVRQRLVAAGARL
ncbi:MAG: hypothetical protein WCI03_08995 [bacterium]